MLVSLLLFNIMLSDNRILYNAYTLGLMNSRYTINIPFNCQQCGRCCAWGYPPPKINETPLPFMAYSSNKNGKKGPTKEMVNKLMTSKPCLFYEDHSCKIYPNRPNICRFYPLGRVERDKKTNEVLCPGRIRFDEIEHIITRQQDEYLKKPCHKKICDINIEYFPSNKQWAKTINNYYKSNPDEKEIELFLQINKR